MPCFVAVTYCCSNAARQAAPSIGELVTAVTHAQARWLGVGTRVSGALGPPVILSTAEAHGGSGELVRPLSPGSEWTCGHLHPHSTGQSKSRDLHGGGVTHSALGEAQGGGGLGGTCSPCTACYPGATAGWRVGRPPRC